MRWVSPEVTYEELVSKTLPLGAVIAEDRMGELAILFNTEWGLQGFVEKNKDIELSDIPFRDAAVVAA
jgi:hypothetical protein